MIDTIKCINTVTEMSAIFERTKLSPFMLKSVDGVSSFKNTINANDFTMQDGAEYLGSVQQKRNIVITGKMLGDVLENKDLLYEVFNRGNRGQIVVTDSDGTERMAYYYPESVDADGNGIPTKEFSISLICPDPAFFDVFETFRSMSNWEKLFKFQHSFKASREPFGQKTKTRLINIIYKSGVETGIRIEAHSIGDVVNPTITNSRTGEHITIGNASFPFTIHSGDLLRITTGDNDKHVILISADKTEKEINQYLTEDSTFIQLQYGSNPIGYSAESGVENLTVDIYYRQKYRGI